MNRTLLFATLALVGLFVAGCGPKEENSASGAPSASNSSSTEPANTDAAGPIATVASYETGSKKVGDKGVCIVCSVNDGKVGEEEEIKQTLDYKGKTYVFCNESEKAEFISDPSKYVSK